MQVNFCTESIPAAALAAWKRISRIAKIKTMQEHSHTSNLNQKVLFSTGIISNLFLTILLGTRNPKARYKGQTKSGRATGPAFVVLALHGNRVFEGTYQYYVEWEGVKEWTWTNADSLSCFDLIDDYELAVHNIENDL